MADLGFPVAGDRKYGNGRDPLHRLALHAFRLNFIHPVTKENMQFETPIPREFLRPFQGNENIDTEE
jgi:23S rRNA pseudouridine1911/1915/1917 synthase